MGVAIAARNPSLRVRSPGGPLARRVTAQAGWAARLERGHRDRPRQQRERNPTGTASRARPYEASTTSNPFGLAVLSGRPAFGSWPVAAGKLNAGHERKLRADELSQLIGDDAEHLRGLGTPGDECGHPPQRGLLINKLAQPCLVGRPAARRGGCWLAHPCAGTWRAHRPTIARCPSHWNPGTRRFPG